MLQKNSRLLIIGAVLVVLAVLAYTFNKAQYSATLKIEVAPQSATIRLNKKIVKAGLVRVKPGPVTVTASRSGFKTETISLSVARNETRYVGIPLISNAPETADWYEQHPADAKIFEGISSKSFDQNSTNIVRNQPFLKLLPFTAAGLEFRIDYGPSLEEPDSTKQAIYISANTQEARASALIWITNQGYDPKKMELVYQSSPELGQPVNNINTSL